MVQVECYPHCTLPKNGVQTKYDKETDTQINSCIPHTIWAGIFLQTKIPVPPWKLVPGFLHTASKWGRLIQIYPGVCYLLHLMWPSQTVLHQQAHCPLVALESKCCYFQLSPWVHPSHPALCWSWWEADISYVGSGCVHPHSWGVPHKLVHWKRAVFPQHIPYFPINPEFSDDIWRWLHGLELYTQPPRLLLYCICHSCICGIWLPSLGRLQPFLSPFGTFPHFLYEFGHIWCCHSLGARPMFQYGSSTLILLGG